MILISHRGNINGRVPDSENNPDYIDAALNLGYDVEVDVWMMGDGLWLGHDSPQYKVEQEWFDQRRDRLWIHCKNITAFEWFNFLWSFNHFWHETDTVTLTSKGFSWAYPGKQPVKGSIAVMPELNDDDISECYGICSDTICVFQKKVVI